MPETVLVTGATGHVGTRLVAELVARGHRVRGLSRSDHDPQDGVEWVKGDVSDAGSLGRAFEGATAAYYLVHGLADSDDLEEVELEGARTFARAAREAGVRRVVYLGGLARGEELSTHLQTRHDVGEALRTDGPPTVELQASVVVGNGSASFELVRTLVDTAPALLLPDWIDTPCQPIAVADVVAYLADALEIPLEESAVYEIGGADKITYRELLELYGDAVGTSRPTLTVPAVPLPLSSMFSRFAPEQARVWLRLVEGMQFESTVRDHSAATVFEIRPRGVREAIAEAIAEPAPA